MWTAIPWPEQDGPVHSTVQPWSGTATSVSNAKGAMPRFAVGCRSPSYRADRRREGVARSASPGTRPGPPAPPSPRTADPG